MRNASNAHKSCEKPKVTNKVPVSELCSFNFTEWENFTYNNAEDLENFCNEHGTNGNYLIDKAVPNKILVHKDKVFVAMNRVVGVYSTLNYFSMSDITSDKVCPKLKCYPNCEVNTLATYRVCPKAKYYLTNVVDMQISKCGVLWVLDSGHYDDESGRFGSVEMQEPCLCQYNLSAAAGENPFMACWLFPEDFYNERNVMGYQSFVVNCASGCDDCFIYVFNSLDGKILVFSLKTEYMWTYEGIKLSPEPDDAVFEVTLPDYTKHSYVALLGAAGIIDGSKLHFAKRPGKELYSIPYAVLEDPDNSVLKGFDNNIKIVGCLNEKGQLNSMVASDDVVFGAQEQNHAIVCYNKKSHVSSDDVQLIVQDRSKYPYIASVCLNSDKPGDSQVYFLSNNLFDIQKNGLNQKTKNFRIFYFNVKEVQQLYPDCKGYFKDLDMKFVLPSPHMDAKKFYETVNAQKKAACNSD
ncbi:protein yellow-like [Culicoides brevitarsis]|uniref:protein yellow-like n=1 Tax=Culicoides brevitarsis TaxID=469753 RepID=UPI00307B33BB